MSLVSCHYLSRTKNKYAKAKFCTQIELAGYQIHKNLIRPKHFTNNIKPRLSNKTIYSKEIIIGTAAVLLKFIAPFPESTTGS